MGEIVENGGMKIDVLKYINTIILALLAFFLVQMYSKIDAGLTSLIAIDKIVTLHGLKIEVTDATVDREIARLERQIEGIRLQPKPIR